MSEMDGNPDENLPIHSLMELGWFSWDLANKGDKKKNKDLANSLTWEQILTRVDVNKTPMKITDLDELNQTLSTKEDFRLSDKLLNRRKNQMIVFWEYPCSIPPVIPIYVASLRACPLHDVDFMVHGSVLGLLSRSKALAKHESVLVQRLGGSIINARIIVEKNGFLGDAGHQFERLVVGDKPFGSHSREQKYVLRLIEIPPFKILVYADSDAIDHNTQTPVEIKTKNFLTEKAFDRDKLKIILQMMSNGSDKLITTDRVKHEDGSFTVNSVVQYPIRTLIESLTEGYTSLKKRIDIIKTNLHFIQSEIEEGDDQCYELTFNKEESEVQPFPIGKSEAKKTQNAYQLLNSTFYEQHFLENNENPSANENIGASSL